MPTVPSARISWGQRALNRKRLKRSEKVAETVPLTPIGEGIEEGPKTARYSMIRYAGKEVVVKGQLRAFPHHIADLTDTLDSVPREDSKAMNIDTVTGKSARQALHAVRLVPLQTRRCNCTAQCPMFVTDPL